MEEKVISTRVDKQLYDFMNIHSEVNWDSVIKKALAEKIRETEKNGFDEEKARKASIKIDEIRKSKIFDNGKYSTELIREWRDKRK